MAIQLLKKCEEEHRQATPEEQKILSGYVGWGGLADAFDESKASWATEYLELKTVLTPAEYDSARASTLNAHYTSPTVIRAIYEAVGKMGFTTGNILEPACGVGNFFGMLPEEMSASRLYGVELDSISGRIAKQLYPKADITVSGFEKTDRRDFYDLAIIIGKKELSPARKNAKKIQTQRVNLLVDIQAKLAEGKGAGYARWAQSFNLKQMASTLNFLTERKLLDYGTLCKRTDEVTARFHELSDQIKAAEARMTEIAVMRQHIINYSKTREVYVAYRKAGYSKKFLAEHEADILLHKAAKKAFDEMSIKKLPTVKSLQAEYA